MYRSILLSLLSFSVGTAAIAEKEEWNPSTLSEKTIEAIQQQTLVYHQCLDRELNGMRETIADSRDATNRVLKQCEALLDPIRDSLVAEKVPQEIATRYLLRKRHQAARQVLKFVMFAQSRQAQ